MSTYELVGNLHVHTCYSDGASLHLDVARAAARAGLDFVVVTDHNVWVGGVEGYHEDVLLLVGEEIHDVRCRPQANHLLVYSGETELVPLAGDTQGLIDEVDRRGGLCYLAHPYERGSSIKAELDPIPWKDWHVEGYNGIELWNYMSEFKGLLSNRLAAVLYAHYPALGIRGPYRATRRRWDQLLAAGRRVTVIGGADAHARTYSVGALERRVFPYEYLFRCVNTHVLAELPFNGDLEHDKKLVYDGLRAGRTWVGYDLPASTSGFRFRARTGSTEALMGAELVRTAAVELEIETPQAADIRLIREGELVARATGRKLKHITVSAGAYRVEAYLRYRLRRRGWIFSSPIYVR